MRNIRFNVACYSILFFLIGLNALLAQDAGSAKLIGPKIKGLAIGMSLDEAKEVVQKLAPESKLQIESTERALFLQLDRNQNSMIPTQLPISLYADLQKSVIYIKFLDTDSLFNTSDLAPENFAREILKAYNLPELKYYRNGAGITFNSGWEYFSEDGWMIDISEKDKSIVLRAYKAKEKKRNFN